MNKNDIERVISAQGARPRISGEYVYAVRVSPFAWRKRVSSRCLGRISGVEKLSEERLKRYITMRFR
jgi:hypothetical protein